MKTKVFTAITLAAIFCMFTFFQCDPRNKPSATTNIAGEWMVDSIYACYSTTDSMRQEIAIRLVTEKKKKFLFNTDSSFIRKSSTNSDSGSYYVQYGTLYLNEDKEFHPHYFEALSDSIFHFRYKDNMMFILKRK